ncbi:hypothetical protein FRX31_026345 [Thalictrum thalictroides]|uniref:Auxin-responsive protein saur32 n=1 Tax=Thalictrum thalictroides TaxID=46969 RepID=A0A7J6VG28_THATH|nr:hypothetical protein FRX31_026345 [Thalictrum thalictroides]
MLVPSTLQSDEKKKKDCSTTKVRKGWIAVRVGLEEEEGGFQTFVIPISDLCHPLYIDLLEKAQEVYGCHTTGLLRLPCSVEEFHNLRCRIEQESNVVPQHHHQPQQLKYLA